MELQMGPDLSISRTPHPRVLLPAGALELYTLYFCDWPGSSRVKQSVCVDGVVTAVPEQEIAAWRGPTWAAGKQAYEEAELPRMVLGKGCGWVTHSCIGGPVPQATLATACLLLHPLRLRQQGGNRGHPSGFFGSPSVTSLKALPSCVCGAWDHMPDSV